MKTLKGSEAIKHLVDNPGVEYKSADESEFIFTYSSNQFLFKEDVKDSWDFIENFRCFEILVPDEPPKRYAKTLEEALPCKKLRLTLPSSVLKEVHYSVLDMEKEGGSWGPQQ